MRRWIPRFLAAAAAVAALLAQPALAQVKDYKRIKFPLLKEFKIPKPEVYKLENGMTVFLMEDHELPLIEVNARIRTGSNHDPKDKVSLADLMADVQRSGGTTSMTGDEIDDFLAARAANIETGMGGDSGYASMDCLKDDFDEVFRVFRDVLRQPAFAQDKLEVAKSQARAGIARRNDNVNAITSREFTRLVYGKDSPLARMTEYSTVTAVQRDDLTAWHKKFYHPNSVYLGVVGDFDSKEMKKKIEAMFGDWQRGAGFSEPEPPYRKEPSTGVYFVEKSDVNQANIQMGHLGISRKNPDYFAVQVMNEVLGGSFASRMFSNIRSKKGLAYSVYGYVGSEYNREGIFRAGLQTKSSSMAEAVEALKVEVRGLIDNPPTEAEINRAKESILNSFVFNYDSKAKILNQQMTYAYFGYPADFLEQYRANIEKVTTEDVARAAKKYVRPDRLTLLVVGKAEDFDQPVSTFGEVVTLDISIPPPPDTTPKVAKTDAGLAAGRKVLERVARALGGTGTAKVEAIRSSGTMVMHLGEQSISVGQTVLYVFPDKIRHTMKTPMGEQVVVLNGGEGFMMMGPQSRPLPEAAVSDARSQMTRDLRYIVRYHDDPKMEAIAAGEEAVDGTRCDVIAVSYRGAESRLWVDSQGRVHKQAYQGSNPMTGAPGLIEAYFSDYRDVDGRQVPHKQTMKVDGEEMATITLESFEVNPEIEFAMFEKPAA